MAEKQVKVSEVNAFITKNITDGEPLAPHQTSMLDAIFRGRTRGKCSVCTFSHKLKKDGNVAKHFVYSGSEKLDCSGSGHPPIDDGDN